LAAGRGSGRRRRGGAGARQALLRSPAVRAPECVLRCCGSAWTLLLTLGPWGARDEAADRLRCENSDVARMWAAPSAEAPPLSGGPSIVSWRRLCSQRPAGSCCSGGPSGYWPPAISGAVLARLMNRLRV
jgi:hypothetical protein